MEDATIIAFQDELEKIASIPSDAGLSPAIIAKLQAKAAELGRGGSKVKPSRIIDQLPVGSDVHRLATDFLNDFHSSPSGVRARPTITIPKVDLSHIKIPAIGPPPRSLASHLVPIGLALAATAGLGYLDHKRRMKQKASWGDRIGISQGDL